MNKYFFLATVTVLSETTELWEGQNLKTGEWEEWKCKKQENTEKETWTCELIA